MKLAINVVPITFVVQGKGLKKAKKKKKKMFLMVIIL